MLAAAKYIKSYSSCVRLIIITLKDLLIILNKIMLSFWNNYLLILQNIYFKLLSIQLFLIINILYSIDIYSYFLILLFTNPIKVVIFTLTWLMSKNFKIKLILTSLFIFCFLYLIADIFPVAMSLQLHSQYLPSELGVEFITRYGQGNLFWFKTMTE